MTWKHCPEVPMTGWTTPPALVEKQVPEPHVPPSLTAGEIGLLAAFGLLDLWSSVVPGLPDPTSIERQKNAYARGLEEQLRPPKFSAEISGGFLAIKTEPWFLPFGMSTAPEAWHWCVGPTAETAIWLSICRKGLRSAAKIGSWQSCGTFWQMGDQRKRQFALQVGCSSGEGFATEICWFQSLGSIARCGPECVVAEWPSSKRASELKLMNGFTTSCVMLPRPTLNALARSVRADFSHKTLGVWWLVQRLGSDHCQKGNMFFHFSTASGWSVR